METINKEYFHTKDAEVKKKKSKLPTLEAIIQGRKNVIKDKGINKPSIPNNIIRYEASAKLPETTSDKTAGLHTNAFNTTIKSHTFENGVGTIEFDDNVTTILGFAFYQTSITKLVMPNSVTMLEGHVTNYMWAGPFYKCSSLREIVLSNNLTDIGLYCFANCSSLTDVTIPNSVTSIGECAFETCSSLTSITIPNSVTSIGQCAFNHCSSLTNVTISSGVTSISDYAFQYCSGLISVTIPDNVTSIGSNAFNSCSGLTSVTIPNSVTSIGDGAFQECSGLTSVTIGSGVTSIGQNAFNNCGGLTSITSLATTAPTISNSTFNRVKTNGTLYVPQGSIGYANWMSTISYYLGSYNWTKVEQ